MLSHVEVNRSSNSAVALRGKYALIIEVQLKSATQQEVLCATGAGLIKKHKLYSNHYT